MQDKDTILKALRHQSRFFTSRKTKTGAKRRKILRYFLGRVQGEKEMFFGWFFVESRARTENF